MHWYELWHVLATVVSTTPLVILIMLQNLCLLMFPLKNQGQSDSNVKLLRLPSEDDFNDCFGKLKMFLLKVAINRLRVLVLANLILSLINLFVLSPQNLNRFFPGITWNCYDQFFCWISLFSQDIYARYIGGQIKMPNLCEGYL